MMLLGISTSSAAELKVFADSPLKYALVKVGAAFEQESGHKVNYVFTSSRDIQLRVAGGEAADVVIVQPAFISALTRDGKLAAGERPIFTRIGFGLAVRTQTASADISTLDGFRHTLLNADLLVFNNRASGDQFAKLLERLGIADALKAKVIRLEPEQVFARVLEGKGNDIAVGTLTQIKGTPGFKLIGPLPGVLQSSVPYAAAPTTNAKSADAANAFVSYVLSSKVKADYIAAGGE